MKIICNTPGKGRELPAVEPENENEEQQYLIEHPELPAYYAGGTTELPAGFSGEVDEVWQYFDGIYKVWKNSGKNAMPNVDKAMGYHVRKVYIATIPAPNSVSEESLQGEKESAKNAHCYAQPVKAVEEEKEVYHVCHVCQLAKMNNCAHFDECGNDKTYPKKLRQLTETDYANKIPLSITVERAYDMGKSHKKATIQPSPQPVESVDNPNNYSPKRIDDYIKELADLKKTHVPLSEVVDIIKKWDKSDFTNIEVLLDQIKPLNL